MQGTPQGFASSPMPVPRRERGALLTILLVLITLGAFFGLGGSLLAFAGMKHLAATNSDFAEGSAPLMKLIIFAVVLGVAQLGCAIGMWSWKKWGVLGYVGIALLSLVLSSRINPEHHFSMINVLWIALVAFAALPKWSHFED